MDSQKEQKAWREIKYSQRFLNAFHGLHILWHTTRQRSLHITGAITAIVLGFCLNVSTFEWIALVFSIGFVFIAEAFNTAIEIDIDLTSPTYHPYARDTKDVAAAAVLLSVFVAVIVGLIIFLPKIIALT